MRTSITQFGGCSISKKGTSKPFLSLRTSRSGAVSDAITTHPALNASSRDALNASSRDALNASSRDHERYFNGKGHKLHESEFDLMLGWCFLAPELIAIPSTRVCAVVGLVVEYFWRTSQ